MNKQEVLDALKQAKEGSSKRNFKQTVDLIINLKNVNLKKPEFQINQYVQLHYGTGKKISICALVGAELLGQAKEVCDEAILSDDFGEYTDKKIIKKLAAKHDIFIAQATVMPDIAKTFGRVFGPKGKMPNPKAGCVVPPNANLKPLIERLKKTVKAQVKGSPVINCAVGKEDSDEAQVADNVIAIYDAVAHALPNGKEGVKNIKIKLTMGKPVKIGKIKEEIEETKGKKGKRKLKGKKGGQPKEEAPQEKIEEKKGPEQEKKKQPGPDNQKEKQPKEKAEKPKEEKKEKQPKVKPKGEN